MFRMSKIHTAFGSDCLDVLNITTVFDRTFFFSHLVLNNRVLIFQVQGSCVVLDARR